MGTNRKDWFPFVFLSDMVCKKVQFAISYLV